VRVARDVHDGVVAVRIRDGGRLGWIQRSVAVVVHVHGPAGESRLARAVRAVGVQVVEHRSRDGGALRVAEVRAGEAGSGRDAHARISAAGRRGARPGGLALLADGVGARLYARDRVGAVARGGRARLARVADAVAVVIHVDGPAGEAVLAGAARAVLVGVAEDGPRHARGAPGPEVLAGRVGSRGEALGVVAGARLGAGPAGLGYLAHTEGARANVRDRVAPVRGGDRRGLAWVERSVVVVVHVDAPAGETRLSAVAQAVGVQVLELGPAHVAGRRVAEVALGDGRPGCERHVRVRAAARMGAHVAGERLLAHGVRARLHAGDRVGAARIRCGVRLARVAQSVAVVV